MPLWCGLQMGQEFGVKGPNVGVLTRELMLWQFAHPQAAAEEARIWLQRRLQQLKETPQ